MSDAPGLILSPAAQVGSGVTFGAHVVVHDGVIVGDGCTIGDGAVLGKAPKLARRSTASREPLDPLVLEEGVIIGTHAIVFAGALVGAGSIVGDQAFVRERALIGTETVVGRASGVDNDVRIGDRVRIQSQAYVTAYSLIEDDVFFGPCAMTTNDDTMARHPKGMPLRGATLRRAARDVARVSGKDVDYRGEGERVELDHAVLDRLRDPLLHLVRNAVDHGLEPPAERTARGKPPTGTVRVRAECRGPEIMITV
ncbi:MAG: hypothetical protein KY433_10690, partial [Actinobacteria bacterium]|nr:hypothetical protein [Actinomycetota bacterium]